MKFECDSCHAQYMIADEKLGTRGVKVKCKRCSHVIIVRPANKGAEGAEAVDEDAPTSATPAPAFLDGDAKGTMPDGAGDLGDFDGDEITRAGSFAADTELGAFAGDDTDAGEPPPPPPPAGDTVVEPTPRLSSDEGAGDEDDNPFLKNAGAQGNEPFRGLGDIDDDDEDVTRADLGRASAAFTAASEGDAEGDDGDQDLGAGSDVDSDAAGSLRMDSEIDKNPFFDDSAEAGDEPPAPPGLDLGADVPAPPPPDAVPQLHEGGEAGAMPAVSAGDDLLEGELEGAFGAMFADADDEGQDRGPTRVLDLGRVDELRAASLRSEVQGGPIDELRSGLGASADAPFSGLSPFASGLHDAGHTMEGAADGSQLSDEDDGDWHAAIDDEDVGPLTLREIGEHIKKGSVDRETLVWRPGMDDWTPAGEVREVRPLFDAVPRPRISTADAVASFDVGQPIDDLGRASASKDTRAADPLDPFGAIPGFDTDDAGSWQPHGLTEVYQAANLAEAAAGLRGSGAQAPAPGAPGPLDDEEEVDWKPAAGSALASLVSSEIERLESPRAAESSLPPAADDSLALDLDSTPLGALSSAGLGGLGSLDVPADVPETPVVAPPFGAVPATVPPTVSGVMPAVSVAGMPMAPYPGMPPPPPPHKNPMVIMAAIGGSVILLLVVLVLVLAFRDPAPVIAQQPMPSTAGAIPGQPLPAAAGTGQPVAAVPPPVAPVAAPAEAVPAGTPPATPDPPAAEAPAAPSEPAAAADATPPAAAEPTPAVAAAAAAEKPAAAPAAKAPSKPAEEKAPSRVASAERKQPERKAERRQQRRQQPKPREQPVRRTRDCDPVLDLDCDERPLRSSSSSGGVKAELTRNDVLAVIKANLNTVNRCAAQHRAKGTLQMEWRVLKSGATSSVRVVSSNFAGTPVGDCVTNAIKRWKFPASQKPPSEAIKFPFKLSG